MAKLSFKISSPSSRPRAHDILKVVQILMRNNITVSESAVFAHLVRKEGLPDSETPIYEEETILAKADSLTMVETDTNPCNTREAGILSSLLAVPDETLKWWKKGETFMREKARVLWH